MKIYLIRHGKTPGNLEKRYVGKTDESLLQDSIMDIHELKKKNDIPADIVFTSQRKRCIQTAQVLYTNLPHEIEDRLNEMDFGEFEYKNYEELKNDHRYQEYINSGGRINFPNGESIELFKNRCIEGFLKCIQIAESKYCNTVAFIIHGGSIMAILEAFAVPKKDYFKWQVDNNAGYTCQLKKTGENLKNIQIEILADIT